ncbi:MAG: DCC1-like thiol-disulfide oxidoreductase family protein [Actinomycetota bacterium]|nr:DCC1-like thiol-disulfide oxidoreductase family protein [Actinomycetota bacterium]
MLTAGRPSATVVFDGDCAFCTTSAARLASWSAGHLEVVPWQRADLAALGLTARECAAAVQYVGPEGHYAAGAAVSRALQRCRSPWREAGRLLGHRALAPFTERIYAVVAVNRHRLPGGTPACQVDG